MTNSMTPEQQQIAIAEACGWKHYHEGLWVTPNVEAFSELDCDNLPDYLNDLNAMHEAEKTLTITLPEMPYDASQRTRYVNQLESMCGSKAMCMATAAQRAEAFLRTLGKWKE